jgi:hypothetical protein
VALPNCGETPSFLPTQDEEQAVATYRTEHIIEYHTNLEKIPVNDIALLDLRQIVEDGTPHPNQIKWIGTCDETRIKSGS